MTKKSPDLDAAYDLKSPEDSRVLYADWAEGYDAGFAREQDYQLPARTAQAFVAEGGRGPVLDVGAGTGLCGAVLAGLGVGPIDATDISAEMLAQAARKDIYRELIEADLNLGVPVPAGRYGGVISSGTFTTGHVGPDAIDEVVRVARPGALVAVSINAAHFTAAGFNDKLRTLERDKIQGLTLPQTRIYGQHATGPHKDDLAVIAIFTRR